MMVIFSMFLVSGLISIIVLGLNLILFFKKSVMKNKKSPFECGFDSELKLLSPFSMQFFLVALIFLIFDVELILLFPVVGLLNSFFSFKMKIMVFFFIMFLSLGVFLEWSQKMLEWSE